MYYVLDALVFNCCLFLVYLSLFSLFFTKVLYLLLLAFPSVPCLTMPLSMYSIFQLLYCLLQFFVPWEYSAPLW